MRHLLVQRQSHTTSNTKTCCTSHKGEMYISFQLFSTSQGDGSYISTQTMTKLWLWQLLCYLVSKLCFLYTFCFTIISGYFSNLSPFEIFVPWLWDLFYCLLFYWFFFLLLLNMSFVLSRSCHHFRVELGRKCFHTVQQRVIILKLCCCQQDHIIIIITYSVFSISIHYCALFHWSLLFDCFIVLCCDRARHVSLILHASILILLSMCPITNFPTEIIWATDEHAIWREPFIECGLFSQSLTLIINYKTTSLRQSGFVFVQCGGLMMWRCNCVTLCGNAITSTISICG